MVKMKINRKYIFLIFNSNTLATWWEELTQWKRPWCWEMLKARGEGDNRGWDDWMASPTQWTSSRSWWWTGKPGVLHVVQGIAESRTRLSDWTELNWLLTAIKDNGLFRGKCLCSDFLLGVRRKLHNEDTDKVIKTAITNEGHKDIKSLQMRCSEDKTSLI